MLRQKATDGPSDSLVHERFRHALPAPLYEPDLAPPNAVFGLAASHRVPTRNPGRWWGQPKITDDISDARVYGGIHFRTDQVAGERLGKAIGKAVCKNNLRRMHDDD